MSDTNKLPVISYESGLNKYLQEVNNIDSLTSEEEFLLAKNYLENKDIEAAHKLVRSHLKLVAKIAMNYRNYGLPVSELISEGNIGLMHAVKKYDPKRGFRLSTYAMWWIKASIQEYVLRSWSLVKIGTTSAQKKLFFTLNKVKKKITNMYSRSIEADDYQKIAKELGVTVKDVTQMNECLTVGDISLNSYVNKNDDSSGEVIDFIPELKPSQEEYLSYKQKYTNQKNMLTEAMSSLTEREAKILNARRLNDSPLTLDVLSNEYRISKERVRQIENRAFQKVQSYMLNRIDDDGQKYNFSSENR